MNPRAFTFVVVLATSLGCTPQEIQLVAPAEAAGEAAEAPVPAADGPRTQARWTELPNGLALSLDLPFIEAVEDPKRGWSFRVPGGTTTGPAFAPLLPLVMLKHALPPGARVERIVLGPTRSETRALPGELERTSPVSRKHGPMEGHFEVPNPYPAELFWWSAREADGKAELTVSITPMQLDPEAGKVTLFHHLELVVHFDQPVGPVQIRSVGTTKPLIPGRPQPPVRVELESDGPREVLLQWGVLGWNQVSSPYTSQAFHLRQGPNTIDLAFPSGRLSARPYNLALDVYQQAPRLLIAAASMPLDLRGLNVELLEARAGAQGSLIVRLAVHDEERRPVDGLDAAAFEIKVDDAPATISGVQSEGAGRHAVTLTGVDTSRGAVVVRASASFGGRGSLEASEPFRVASSLPAAP